MVKRRARDRQRLQCLSQHVVAPCLRGASILSGADANSAASETTHELGSRLPAVSALPLAPGARRLTADEKLQFQQSGFVSGLPVMAPEATHHLIAKYNEITAQLAALPQPLTTNEVFWFFKSSRWIYDLTMLEVIHNYVEDLVGPDFYLCECATR
eukprot:COSAG02_NODE_3093_length_7383_cov_2.908018_6_plen_156_part_00